MSERTEFTCQNCGSQNIGLFVQYGSYFTRCFLCKQDGWATSWLMLSKQIVVPIYAIVVDEQHNEIEVLGEGFGEEFLSRISRAADKGKTIRLLPANNNL